MTQTNPLFSPIARRIILYMIICSSLITLITTVVQLYADYRHDLSLIDIKLNEINNVHLSSLEEALWETDKINIDTFVAGIKRMPNVQYVSVYEKDRVWSSIGIKQDKNIIRKIFPMTHPHKGKPVFIGNLEVVFSLNGIYQRLLNKFWVILVSNGIKTFIVASFMFFIFQLLVTRHLHRLAELSRNTSPESLDQAYTFERHILEPKENDELDVLLHSLNQMKQKISENVQELKNHRDLLEVKVKERTMELEAKNNELESFSYSISHDLRTPLRAIHGFSQILTKDYLDKTDPKATEYFNRIIRASTHMSSLIDSMLRLAHIGQQEISPKMVDVTQLCHNIISRLKEQSILAHTEISVEADLQCHCDEALIQIAFENLIRNAVKYSSKAEHPHITVGHKILNQHDKTFYVKDNGIGFEMEYSDKLFKPFQRLHNNNEYTGMGVGLTIVKRIVDRHKGKIWAESTINEGTTFYLSVPNR